MEQKATIAVIATIILLSAGCIGAFVYMNNGSGNGIDLSKDAVGREVSVPDNLDKGIAAIGVGTARWVSYFGLDDSLVLRDYRDNANFFGKSYMYANGSIVGVDKSAGAGLQAADAQTILNLSPSLVILSNSEYNEATNVVESIERGGVNVVVIYELEEMLDSDLNITEKFEYQTKLLGKVFGLESAANTLLDGIRNTVTDLQALVSGKASKGYIGGLAYSGTKGADSTSGTYIPFLLSNVDNAISGSDFASERSVAEITAAVTSDTVVFIDDSAKKDTKAGSDLTQKALVELFNAKGVKGYSVMPYIYFGLNFENVLIAAYQIAYCVYDGLLTESELQNKINGVYDLFFGSHLSTRTTSSSGVAAPVSETTIYDDMNNVFLGSTSNNGLGMSLCQELTFNADGTITAA